MIRVRSFWYRNLVNPKSGKFLVYGSIKIYSPSNLVIGEKSTINHGCILNARDSLRIGDDVHLSPGTIINTGGLEYSKTGEHRVHVKEGVTIESGVWVGSGAIINPGVTIGFDSVIGAGSVVTKDIPSKSVAVGIPCRVIKSITD